MNEDPAEAFKRAGKTEAPGLVREFVLFLKENKKYWLIPPVVALLLIAVVVMLGGTAAAPFIYSLF